MVEDADESKTRQAIEHVQNKISRTRDQIKGEQTARDGKLLMYYCLFYYCNFFPFSV